MLSADFSQIQNLPDLAGLLKSFCILLILR